MGAPGILEQKDTMKCRRSHPPVLFLVSVQLMKKTMWWCWGCTCGIFVVEVWVATFNKQPTSWLLERKSEVWSLEVHRIRITKFDDQKDLDVEITLVVTFFLLLENLSKSCCICIQDVLRFPSQNHHSLSFWWHLLSYIRLELPTYWPLHVLMGHNSHLIKIQHLAKRSRFLVYFFKGFFFLLLLGTWQHEEDTSETLSPAHMN